MDQDTTRSADLIAFLRGLRSVRHFLPIPVPATAIDDILTVARWSGSARNLQHWQFVVVRDPAMLHALGALEGHAAHVARAPLAIVLVMAGQLAEQETFDEGKVSERMMLAAAAHGLGACIGWFRGGGVDQAKALLGIPAECLVRTAISIGYPDQAAHQARPKPARARKPVQELVFWERYG
jgi:nitroreductase